MSSKILLRISLATSLIFALAACSSGSTAPAPLYATVSVPVVGYGGSKFAIYSSVAGGSPVLTEIDTGSDFMLVESSYVGNNLVMTNESITFTYDHGTNPRSGVLAYTSVSLLSGNMQPIIATNDQVPVIVVADGVVGSGANHAIMGLRMNSNVSLKLFLAYPYNQMFYLDAPGAQIVFGNLNPSQLAKFATAAVPPMSCDNYGVTTTATAPCWNDMAIPLNYVVAGDPNGIETYPSLFDSGASSSFQFSPMPSWFDISLDGSLTNTVTAVINTKQGNQLIYLTSPIAAYNSDYNGGAMVNVGNKVFNYYQVLFNQAQGTLGLANTD